MCPGLGQAALPDLHCDPGAVVQVHVTLLQRAPCAVAAQILLRTAPMRCASLEGSSGGAIGDVAQAAAEAWANRTEASVVAEEPVHEGMLRCAARGWPWFAAAASASEVLAGASSSGSGASGPSGSATSRNAADAIDQVLALRAACCSHDMQVVVWFGLGLVGQLTMQPTGTTC